MLSISLNIIFVLNKFFELLQLFIALPTVNCVFVGKMAYADVSKKKGEDSVIRVFSSSMKSIANWSDTGTWSPRGVALNNRGQIIVSNLQEKRHSVGIYTFDGKPYLVFGTKGKGDKQFDRPYYINVDIYDRILVSDFGNDCVKVFDERGHCLGIIGRDGPRGTKLSRPRGVCCDSRGNILVADSGHNRINVYSPDGQFIQHILTSKDGLYNPYGLDVSRSGLVACNQHLARGDFGKLRYYQLDLGLQTDGNS